jgi:hypothetical protein
MDKDEELGLRAFALRVGDYSGASSPERPEWVELNGERLIVTSVEAQWREEDRLGFRVRLGDGAHMLLYYVAELDLWSGFDMAGGAPAIVRRRTDPAGAGG